MELKAVPEKLRENIELWVGCISGALAIDEYERILKKVGFKNIEIMPSNNYTKAAMRNMAEAKNLKYLYDEVKEEILDGAFASALVKAYKEE